MLEMIHGKTEKLCEEEMLCIKETSFPAPFLPGLEYNSPAHGTWNIVHTGMLIPGAHQIYVCAANCNRGVVLTAAEMNAADRFSSIAIYEDDLINGDMEELVIEGVTEILRKLPKKPTVVLLFTVCIHHFMGCDLLYIYQTLRERFPEQRFVDCYMDPIMQKGGLTPDQKLRTGLYACLEKREKNPRQISILGNDFATDPDCEMLSMMRNAGFTVKDITICRDFEEYLSMAESGLNISTYPPARVGAEILSQRLETDHLYLPQCFGYDEIDRYLGELAAHLKIKCPDTKPLRQTCEKEFQKAKKVIGETKIVLDASAAPRLLGMTRQLICHGFRVVRIYADSFLPEEKEDYLWLKEHVPDLMVCATIHANMRVFDRGQEEKILAIGQKAAYFHQTPYFVNMVEGGGLYGYRGICSLLEMMCEAYGEKKDTKNLVIRKGLGCESCI